ncbi:unnamed protein product [Heterobilharzia americana]|nr:unnamed protein product [Heterobilharzia americana]
MHRLAKSMKRKCNRSTLMSLHRLKLIIASMLCIYSINSPKCCAYYQLEPNQLTGRNNINSETPHRKTSATELDHSESDIHNYPDFMKNDAMADSHLMMSSLNDVLFHSPSSSSGGASGSPSSVSSSSSHGEVETHRCEPITLILCKGMYYEYTRLPNMFHHETQEEAGLEAHQFYPLVQINCSKDLRFLLCSIYTPICVKGYPHFLPPCRSVCQRVKAGCSPIMEHYEFPWPERMNCEQFPEYNNPEGILCMERNLTQEELQSSEEQKKVTQQPIIQLEEVSKDLKLIPSIEVISADDQLKTSSDTDIHTNQLNEDASNILFERAMRNEDIKKLKSTFPDLRLKCTCECRPPLVKITDSDVSANAKISVADIKDCTMPCHTPYYSTDSSNNFTTFWLAIWSIFCAISTLITIFTFITDSYRFQYPELPLIYLSACYFMISIGYLIRVFMGHQAVACDSLSSEHGEIPYGLVKTTKDWFDKPELLNIDNMQTITPTTSAIVTTATMTTVSTTMPSATATLTSNIFKSTDKLIRSKLLRYAFTGRASCAAVFLLIYFFSMAASIWWVVLALTWLLAAGLKWGSEAISKYSQVFHFIAWSLPASQTALALLLSVVEGDPVSGLCTIQSSKPVPLILFTFLPLLVYLLIGIILMMIGFIALFRIRGAIKLQRPRLVETQKLDRLIIRIGIFGMLYAIPNLVILFCIGYELRDTHAWQLGIACHCHYDIGRQYEGDYEYEPILPVALPAWNAPKPEYAVFMLKHFMSLVIGITSGFWIWSNKTIESWRRFCFSGKCLFRFSKHNSGSGLLVSPHGVDQDICHKRRVERWMQIPPTVSMQSVSKLGNTRNTPMTNVMEKYPKLIQSNEQCNTMNSSTVNQHNSTSYDVVNNNSSNINPMIAFSTPSTPFSMHPYDVPIHDINSQNLHYNPPFSTYYSIDGSTVSQQYGDLNPCHINSTTCTSNNKNNVADNKFTITHTKSFATQISSSSINPGQSTLNSTLNSPRKSSLPHLVNNNHNNNNNNNHSSVSTGISSSGIGSGKLNDDLTRTASILTGSENNYNLFCLNYPIILMGNRGILISLEHQRYQQ